MEVQGQAAAGFVFAEVADLEDDSLYSESWREETPGHCVVEGRRAERVGEEGQHSSAQFFYTSILLFLSRDFELNASQKAPLPRTAALRLQTQCELEGTQLAFARGI